MTSYYFNSIKMKAIIVLFISTTLASSTFLPDNKVPPETYLNFLDYTKYFKIPVE